MPAAFLSQAKALHDRLTLNQKLSILALAVVVLLGILLFTFMVRQEPYQLLLSDLDATNANAVVARLRELDVPYELVDGGRSITVPANRIDEIRLEVASQGLPTVGRMGFELFDQNNWSITDFTEKVNYRRALEGELERTILSLSEILQARVHLVLRKESLFAEAEQPAKASVVIKIRQGETLSPARLRGIRNLVAFAVEGLETRNVTVVDVNGAILSADAPSQNSELADEQLTARRKLEESLCQKVISILEPIVGADQVRVTASVELDRRETEQTEQIFDPEKSVIVSQQKSEEIVRDSEAREGIPLKANDSAAATRVPATEKGRSLTSETTNYELSKTVRQTKMPGGEIVRLSVAVVVNNKIKPAPGPGSVPRSEPRSSEEMARLRSLVSSTIGFNQQRGDILTVENVAFSLPPNREPSLPSRPFWETNKDLIHTMFRYLVILLLFGLFYLVIFRPVKKRVFAFVEQEGPAQKQLLASIPDPALVQQLETRLGQAGAANALPEAQKAAPMSDRSAAIRKELIALAKEDPQLVTQIIRGWLSEGV
ncbi:MAG: flagellar basal-body MS-ring/collar protein FliF [Acidobacteriota bacterium]